MYYYQKSGRSRGRVSIIRPAMLTQRTELPCIVVALRLWQGGVAGALYFGASCIRSIESLRWLTLLLLVLATPIYRFLSRNRAGGYYDTLTQQFTRLPTHFKDIMARDKAPYAEAIARELSLIHI